MRVIIIGTGLIGTSVALALRERGRDGGRGHGDHGNVGGFPGRGRQRVSSTEVDGETGGGGVLVSQPDRRSLLTHGQRD